MVQQRHSRQLQRRLIIHARATPNQRPDGTAVYSEDEDADDFEVINRKTVTTSTRSDARPWQDTQESLFIYVGYHVLSYVSFRRRD